MTPETQKAFQKLLDAQIDLWVTEKAYEYSSYQDLNFNSETGWEVGPSDLVSKFNEAEQAQSTKEKELWNRLKPPIQCT